MLGKYNTRPAWGKLYKRNIVEDVSFVEDCIFEEVRYSAETFLKAEKVIFANKDLYSYRIRPNSIMTSIQNTQIYCEQVVDTKVFKKYVGELVKLYYKGGI